MCVSQLDTLIQVEDMGAVDNKAVLQEVGNSTNKPIDWNHVTGPRKGISHPSYNAFSTDLLRKVVNMQPCQLDGFNVLCSVHNPNIGQETGEYTGFVHVDRLMWPAHAYVSSVLNETC